MDTNIKINTTGDLVINGYSESPRVRDIFRKDIIEYYIQLSRFQVIKLLDVLSSSYNYDEKSALPNFLERSFFYNGSCNGFLSLLEKEEINYNYQNWLN